MLKPVVLSVEDDDGGYVVLRELLRETHSDVRLERARDGSEALTKLKALTADTTVQVRLVLLDLRLPGLSGIEVLAAIRGDQSFRQIPIVVLTGKAREADRVLCLENGAQGYFEKPWDLQGLETVIRAACATAGF
jgi:CheY-like chemotaxis protein